MRTNEPGHQAQSRATKEAASKTALRSSSLRSAPVMLNWQISFVTTGFCPLILKSNLTSALEAALTGFVLDFLQAASRSETSCLQSLTPTSPKTKLLPK